MSLTLVEKIAMRHAVDAPGAAGEGTAPGEAATGGVITIRPRRVTTRGHTAAVLAKFAAIGGGRIHDPGQLVFAFDDDVAKPRAEVEAFAREHAIDRASIGAGGAPRWMVDGGYAVPGSLVVTTGTDAAPCGAVAALAARVVPTDAASIWAIGTTWWEVPPVARVELQGALRSGVTGKDVIAALCRLFDQDEVQHMAVEFVGEGIAGLAIDERLTMAGLAGTWGASAGVFPFDGVLRDALYDLAQRGAGYTRADVDDWYADRLLADADAHYAVELTLDLATVVAGDSDAEVAPSGTAVRRGARAPSGGASIIDGFPEKVVGRLLWLGVDDLETEDIYAGALAGRDDVSPEKMAAASFANHDPDFDEIAREGDIIVAGANFGRGASREEAATCLRLRGIPCMIAASFAETYKRNALNRGFLVFECPGLVEHLRVRFPNETAATVVGPEIEVDFEASCVNLGDADETEDDRHERFMFTPLGATIQELIVAGGTEALVRLRLAAGAGSAT